MALFVKLGRLYDAMEKRIFLRSKQWQEGASIDSLQKEGVNALVVGINSPDLDFLDQERFYLIVQLTFPKKEDLPLLKKRLTELSLLQRVVGFLCSMEKNPYDQEIFADLQSMTASIFPQAMISLLGLDPPVEQITTPLFYTEKKREIDLLKKYGKIPFIGEPLSEGPQPLVLLGEPIKMLFHRRNKGFLCTFRSKKGVKGTSQIHIPPHLYPKGCYHVRVSDGIFEKDEKNHRLLYEHSPYQTHHTITIFPKGSLLIRLFLRLATMGTRFDEAG